MKVLDSSVNLYICLKKCVKHMHFLHVLVSEYQSHSSIQHKGTAFGQFYDSPSS